MDAAAGGGRDGFQRVRRGEPRAVACVMVQRKTGQRQFLVEEPRRQQRKAQHHQPRCRPAPPLMLVEAVLHVLCAPHEAIRLVQHVLRVEPEARQVSQAERDK